MKLLVIGFGSNLGDREDNLAKARQMINQIWESPIYSRVFQTLPWGIADQPLFLNQVGMGYTAQSPFKILEAIKNFERQMGRTEGPRNGPRIIDLDILYYSDWVLVSDILTIPHPRLHERAFTLLPLSEIMPDWIHPVKMKSHQELLNLLDPPEDSCRIYEAHSRPITED
ncbi:MAG TPA: 2-amino-4-hydroxy-6-hydroxymethyldihydropteridine diphosphokinase [Bacillota bacterium]|nr:2-amino-4-hydroxy-6-hydroxymethyldihydropteridine diphosphokinase [Bacillota bacterium]